MSVTKDEVKHIAQLAKLYFDDAQLETMRKEMETLVDFAQALSRLDTQNLSPLSHIQENENVFDEDVLDDSHDLKALLANAPETSGDYFVVPKVVD